MNRLNERVSRRWSTSEISRRNHSSSSEESSSLTDSTEHSLHVQNTSTPLGSGWSNSGEINRSRRGQGDIKGTEEVSSDKKELKKFQRQKERANRKRYQDNHERLRRGHDRRERQRHDRRFEDSANKKQKETSSSESSNKNYGDDELPITEILKRSQENAHTKYEHETPLPVLTTDKIYVQHRGGFSAIKINQMKNLSSDKKPERESSVDLANGQNSPPIKMAITLQQFWKNAGFLYQGLLGGLALMHFIMLHVFFNNSMEFIMKYSTFCEIYTNVFSFLIVMCIVTTFDRFDLARFNVEHLRELYFDYNKAVIAVPLYLIVFCLHQVNAGTDNQLTLLHYYSSNDSSWQNVTNVQSLLDDLNSWQKISMSKDLLAIFAWLFVSLGTKDDSFLMYLQSMEKYANDIESSRR
ncbi:hypothetical protein WN51_03368 [Melipona quadrifasciata]|uniref:Transmembrane protein 237 n=1 Tax=Melipona quadrifasciata TaxID=166423 RepID=A0A0M8ZWE8_9HYME|nr:hypothetical protein WN51_03368 [Melipona quadrifasciata]